MSSKRFALKISAKLMMGAGFFLLAFILFQMMVGVGLSKIGKQSATFQQNQATINAFIHDLLVATDQLSNDYLSFKLSTETGGVKTLNVSALSKAVNTVGQKQSLVDMPEFFQKGISEISSIARQIAAQTINTGSSTDEIPALLSKINRQIEVLIAQQNAAAEEFGVAIAAKQKALKVGIFSWMTITIIVVLLIYILIIRSIRVRVQKTLKFAEEIASGNLAATSEISSGDEIGQINDALADLKEKLREVLNSIKDISINIMNASAEFNSGSQLISGGASSQASSSEEISAAMEQIAEMIKQSTDNASETGQIAKKAFEGIQHGANQVESALSVIEDIAQKNSIIGEISYQTKILSINASVEASRAAEIGRGFAVVAEEVKRLAESTQSSASEITRVSKKGVDLARRSANELRGLVGEFQRTSELVTKIAEAGNEHINTIVQINYSLQDLNNITQQNASSAEELAASSDELVKLTKSLDDLISYFKLEEDIATEQHASDEDIVDIEKGTDEDSYRRWDNYDFSDERKEATSTYVSSFAPKAVKKVDLDTEDDKEIPLEAQPSQEVPPEIVHQVFVEKPSKIKTPEDKVKPHAKGVRINLTDNDDIDSQFEKMK